MNKQDIIDQIRKTMPTQIANAIAGVQPMGSLGGVFDAGRPVPDNWQTYLRRLGNGINGVSERTKTLTEKDIIANAEHYMQKKYPGPYRVESYYNADKMKYDLRLRFDDPKQETMWLIRWSS